MPKKKNSGGTYSPHASPSLQSAHHAGHSGTTGLKGTGQRNVASHPGRGVIRHGFSSVDAELENGVIRNRFAPPDGMDPRTTLKYLQEMFHGRLDSDVVHLVFSECEYNADQAIETLFTLLCDIPSDKDLALTQSKSKAAEMESSYIVKPEGITFDTSLIESNVKEHHVSSLDGAGDEVQCLCSVDIHAQKNITSSYESFEGEQPHDETQATTIEGAKNQSLIITSTSRDTSTATEEQLKTCGKEKCTFTLNAHIEHQRDAIINSLSHMKNRQSDLLFSANHGVQGPPALSNTLPHSHLPSKLLSSCREPDEQSAFITPVARLTSSLPLPCTSVRTSQQAAPFLRTQCQVASHKMVIEPQITMRNSTNPQVPSITLSHQKAQNFHESELSWHLQKKEILKQVTEGNKVMIMMRGLPGSGKTHLARQLQYTGLVLSTDDYFYQNGHYIFEAAMLSEAHEWNKLRARTAMEKKITPVIIDNTNLQTWEMKPYISLALKYFYQPFILEPDTPWKFNLRELSIRNSHSVSKQKISRMLERYERNVSVENIILSIQHASDADEKNDNACFIEANESHNTVISKIASVDNDISQDAENVTVLKTNVCQTHNSEPSVIIEDFKIAGDNQKTTEMYEFEITNKDSASPQNHTRKLDLQDLIMLVQGDNECSQNSCLTSSSCSSQDMPSWNAITEHDNDFSWSNKMETCKIKNISSIETEKPDLVDLPSCSSSESDQGSEHLFTTSNTEWIISDSAQTTDCMQSKISHPDDLLLCQWDSEELPNSHHDAKLRTRSPLPQRMVTVLNRKNACDGTYFNFLQPQESIDTNFTEIAERNMPDIRNPTEWESCNDASDLNWENISRRNSLHSTDGTDNIPKPQRSTNAGEDCHVTSCADLQNLEVKGVALEQGYVEANFKNTMFESAVRPESELSVHVSAENQSLCTHSELCNCHTMSYTMTDTVGSLKQLVDESYENVACKDLINNCSLAVYHDNIRSLSVMESRDENRKQASFTLPELSKEQCVEAFAKASPPDSEETVKPLNSKQVITAEYLGAQELSSTSDSLCHHVDRNTTHCCCQTEEMSSKLKDLQNCFPDVSPNDLEDILSKCHGDHIWAVNILLDSGYEYNTPSVSQDMTVSDKPCSQNVCNLHSAIHNENKNASSYNSVVDTANGCKIAEDDNFVNLNRNTVSCAINEDQADTKFKLILDPAFAFQLQEVFGAIISTHGASGVPERFEVMIDIPCAREIHRQWRNTVEARSTVDKDQPLPDVENEPVAQTTSKPHEEASATHIYKESVERETRSGCPDMKIKALCKQTSHHSPQTDQNTSLTEIMDMEMALQLSRETMMQHLRKNKSKEISIKLKQYKLHNMFPGVDPAALDEVFESTNYSLEQAIATVEGTIDQKGEAQSVWPAMSKASNEDSYAEVTAPESVKMNWLSPVFRDEGNPKSTLALGSPNFEDLRSEAALHYALKNECFQKSNKAYNDGLKAASYLYSQQGHIHASKVLECNEKASEKILEIMNSHREPNVLDLHGLYVKEALNVMKEFFKAKEADLQKSSHQKMSVFIITGHGSHSAQKVPRIKPAVLGFLNSWKYRYEEVHAGLLRVVLS